MTRRSIVLGCVWIIATIMLAARPEADAMAAHRHGDSVSKPRFVAAMNDFMSRHPKDTVEGTLDHVRKLDKGDVERWHEVEQAWKDLHDDYKGAGY
jgi:ribosomal 50S subunit-associated protein YjgA (DUF615 family)